MKSIADEEALWRALSDFKLDFEELINSIDQEFVDFPNKEATLEFEKELKKAANYVAFFARFSQSFKCKNVPLYS